MKKALISPEETRYLGIHTKTIDDVIATGARVAEIADTAFEVAEPLFWVDCPDNYVAHDCVYVNGEVVYAPRVVIDAAAVSNSSG
jgi:hypothetical protein